MLRAYRMVYVKPDRGTIGRGILKVNVAGYGNRKTYRYQRGIRVKSFADSAGQA